MVEIKIQELRRFKGYRKIFMEMDALGPAQTMQITVHEPVVIRYLFENNYKGKYGWVSEKQISPDYWLIVVKKK